MRSPLQSALITIALTMMPTSSWGHSLYVLPAQFHAESSQTIVFSVHNGDSFPASEEAADPNRIVVKSACGDSASRIDNFQKLGKAIHAAVTIQDQGPCWIVATTLERDLEMEPAKFEAYLKDEGLESIIEWRETHGEAMQPGRERYRKFAKSLITVGSEPKSAHSFSKIAAPMGWEIEFVTEIDPSTLKPGDALPVQVLRNGKPLAGVRVESAWATDSENGNIILGRTDEWGRIDILLDRAGRWRLHTVTMERLPQNAGADWHSYWASLTFEIQ